MMRIGISCYASYGGSGVVASELANALARAGDEIHVLSNGRPPRLDEASAGGETGAVHYHPVVAASYPLFEHPPVALAMANRMVEIAHRHKLDLLHVHYVVPHGVSAWLAREMVGRPLPIVLTCHGTDVSPVGNDPAYLETTRHSLLAADAVTVVSHALEQRLHAELAIEREVSVIPNFVDTERFQPPRERNARARGPVLVHVSNFRPVKRPIDVVEIFRRLRSRMRCRLLMVGDGPMRAVAAERCGQLGLTDDVEWTGNLLEVESALQRADLMLLPSAQESFGVAALEAMACGVPVLASAVGGTPEVVAHGETGFLCRQGDLEGFAHSAELLFSEKGLLQRFARQARERVLARFTTERVTPLYRNLYERVLAGCRPTLSQATGR